MDAHEQEIIHRIFEAESKISSHEEVCAVRYEGINRAVEKLEHVTERIMEKLEGVDAKIERTSKELKATITKYVVATLVFVIVTLLSAAGYLYIELNDKTADRYTGQQGQALEHRVERLEQK